MIVLGLVRALGLRGTVVLACLLVLAVTAYGVADDLGLLEPPAQAAPAPKPTAGQPAPSSAAVSDIPPGYLRLYRQAGARYRVPWSVLAAIGKVESDHGRTRLAGVRSGSNWAGACGPMQLGCVPGSKAVPTTPRPRSQPPPDIWSTTASATTWTAPCSPTTTPGPTSARSRPSPAATAVGVSDGDRHRRPP
jgi:hypothetical protein